MPERTYLGVPPHLENYERARKRLRALRALPVRLREAAWLRLAVWAAGFAQETGRKLPAPALFATPEGQLEYAWERDDRSLTLRVWQDGQEYFALDEGFGTSFEAAGPFRTREAHRLLLWVLEETAWPDLS